MEPEEANRNSRTVFAYMLPADADKYKVRQYFEKAGRVNNLTWSLDLGKNSKGYAYALVEFFDVKSVPHALEFPSGRLLANQEIRVIPVEGEREFVQFSGSHEESTSGAGPEGAVAKMFYITNLDPESTETELEELFAYFGCVAFVMMPEEPGRPAKVQFAAPMLVEEITKGKLLNLRNQEIKVSNRDPEADDQEGAVTQLDSRRTFGCSFSKMSHTYKEPNGFIIEELEDEGYYSLNMRDGFSLVTSPKPKPGRLMVISDASCYTRQFGYGGVAIDHTGKRHLIVYGNIIDSCKNTSYREAVGVRRLLVNIDQKLLRLFPYLIVVCDNKGVIDLLKGLTTTRSQLLASVIEKIKAIAREKYGSRVQYKWSCRETGLKADRASRMGLELKPNTERIDNTCQDWTLQEFSCRQTYCKNDKNAFRDCEDGNTNQLPVRRALNFIPFVVGNSSRYLLLKNVFRRESEHVLDFDHVKSNVLTSCFSFGVVKRCHVYKRSAGHVCLEFSRVEDAVNYANWMHYQWFYGRLILVNFCRPLLDEQKAEMYEYSKPFISAPARAGRLSEKRLMKLTQELISGKESKKRKRN